MVDYRGDVLIQRGDVPACSLEKQENRLVQEVASPVVCRVRAATSVYASTRPRDRESLVQITGIDVRVYMGYVDDRTHVTYVDVGFELLF